MNDVKPDGIQGARRRDEDGRTGSGTPPVEGHVPGVLAPGEEIIRSFHEHGDIRSAVRAAVILYGRELLAFVQGILGAPAAEDANMEVWEAVLRGVDRFRWTSTFRAWAYTIARRTCYHHLKGRNRERRHKPLSEAPEIEALVVKVRTETAPFERSEVRNQIAEIRDGLSPQDRMLLMLHVDRGMAWSDVARVMFDDPVPDQNAVVRLRKRYQRIKKHILEEARRRGLL